MSEDFTREVELGDGRTLTIHQELISDVGGVIWDSALVAAHLFLKNREYWMDKKVVELGAGTGVCGLVLGALGAEVLLTDLPERLPLLEKNLSENQHLLKGKVHAKSLDWLKDPIPESFSMKKCRPRAIHQPARITKKLWSSITNLIGTAEKNTSKLVLDSNGLAISSIKWNDKELKYTIESNGPLGQKLEIDFGSVQNVGSLPVVTIAYTTGENAAALQFLTGEQTTDKKAPYLFSQCQAIHARTIVPSMDTPSVKSTYSAKVSVPKGLTCLMSAIGDGNTESGDVTEYKFNQPVAVPAYLLAIVVGHLEQRVISERCAVWSEPSVAEAAAYEFAETEKILKVAEDVAGPYVWGRYDLVVLPATFPFGGMENPCLTFVTPTLLAGDRSLVNVIAHEISHSWTGNLVTNCSWEHFWLNEGFTVFLERKIHGRMYGEQERQFESECGFQDTLVPTVEKVFGRNHEFTKLVQNLKGVDPDDAFSCVPYEKGSALLFTIEQLIGDNERFEKFLKTYISKFAHKSVYTDQWKENLYEFFSDKKAVLDSIDWNLWLNRPGVPPKPKYDSTLMTACKQLASQWTSSEAPPTDSAPFIKMGNSQRCAVIDAIRASGGFSEAKMPQLTTTYQLDQAKNCELKFSWLMLGLEIQWQPILEPSLAFALAIGRMKYCKPIYRALFAWPQARDRAIAQFKANIPNMHPITASVIQKLL
ncbi:unnamed protein product [Caenorhabditis auriculariae]|uniref:Peptidase M1 leukotriene A4 hydrolase/aminopeptidase C-terminal domain-containing protein n=1 Tax=Caenorhabditis auriculariae TaxID=2777116 RepID=A0A8S1HLC4_9PELO|nr:unnamed protein product [Caenorhabditis auriculariae]